MKNWPNFLFFKGQLIKNLINEKKLILSFLQDNINEESNKLNEYFPFAYKAKKQETAVF